MGSDSKTEKWLCNPTVVENGLPPTYGQGVKDMGRGYQDFLSGESPLGDKVLAILLHGDTL